MQANHASSPPLPVEKSESRITVRPPVDPAMAIEELRARQRRHPFWNNALFQGFRAGAFSRADLRYIFAEYQLYSKSFTRFLSALMANCENDFFRSRLSENLWEEGGGCEPEKRHAELFRRFMRDALGIADPDATEYESFTRHFVREYLVFCLRSEPAAASAFLSLGTEAIVPQMYSIFVEGLKKAGISDGDLSFFHLHMACDDAHAATLEEIMVSYAAQPAWFETCLGAMNHALVLRTQFFENIAGALRRSRLDELTSRIQARTSLTPPSPSVSDLRHRPGEAAPVLYSNRIESENIEFTVDRIPLRAEVLDPRMVCIPPGKNNELHRHAHETLIYFLEGTGHVVVDGTRVEVAPGDSVLVPRWALHQTQNTGSVPIRFLAVTDFNLTDRALIGDAKAYRLNEEKNAHRSG